MAVGCVDNIENISLGEGELLLGSAIVSVACLGAGYWGRKDRGRERFGEGASAWQTVKVRREGKTLPSALVLTAWCFYSPVISST